MKKLFIALIVFIGISVTILVFVSRSIIKKNVDEKISYLRRGNLEWVYYSGLDVSPEIILAINKADAESTEIFSSFISANDVTYKIGMVLPWKTKVTFSFNGYDFARYLKACEGADIKDSQGMKDMLEAFMSSETKDFNSQAVIVYSLKGLKWVSDYNDKDFVNGASCGIPDQYSDYYSQTIENLQRFIEETQNEE